MSKDKINKIIDEIVSEMKSGYPDFRGLYLFGSHARGEATEDSDIDLALVFDREIDWRFKSQVRNHLIKYDLQYDILTSGFLFKPIDITTPRMPLTENISKEGLFYG
jgi:uncharacterized protein